MIQLVAVAAAFLFTLFMILGGIANIQDNLGEYRRQLDAEGFEGITLGHVNQIIVREGGLLEFLRTNCSESTLEVEFNPKINNSCFNDEGFKKIFGFDRRAPTNELRKAQSIAEIAADQSEIQFEFNMMKPGTDLWQFVPIESGHRLMNVSYIEVTATVFLKKKEGGEIKDVQVFLFRRVFRP